MEFRRNPRVYRAWRAERSKTPAFSKLAPNGRDLRGSRKRSVPEYTRKGRW